MRLLSRAGGRTDRQRSLFEASALRLAQVIEAATEAGVCVHWVEEAQAIALWRKAAALPASTILPPGRVLAVVSRGDPLRLTYLNISRGPLTRASISNPQPLLMLSRAIESALDDIRGPLPDRPEYVAYYRIQGRMFRTEGITETFRDPIEGVIRHRRLASG